jgi:hypothetical protein
LLVLYCSFQENPERERKRKMREEDLIVCSALLLYDRDKHGDGKVDLYRAPLTAALAL